MRIVQVWLLILALAYGVRFSQSVQQDDTTSSKPRYPVVLVPGLVGSVLDAKLNRTSAVSWWCTRHADWRVIFLSFREVLSPECLCDELRMYYDSETVTYHDQKGVDVRAHDFGGLQGISALDPSEPRLTATYLPLIRALKAAGYKERETLWGAPYDWRLAGDGLASRGVADDMQSLIETAYTTGGDTPVVLVAHSMGNIVISYFMQLWGEAWTTKYIREMVAVSGPWGGSVNSLKAAISGDNFKLYFPHNLLHSVQGTVPSAPWLFPSPHVWHADDVLVSTRNQTWAAAQLNNMLEDVGLHQLTAMYPKLLTLHKGQLDAGYVPVPLTCIHGNGVDTDQAYYYDVDNLQAATAPEPTPTVTNEGDGTVGLRSLKVCSKAGPAQQTTMLEVDQGEHLGILSSKKLLSELSAILELDMPARERMLDASAATVAEICAQAQPSGRLRTLGSRALALLSWGRNAWGADLQWLAGQGHCR